MIVRNTVQHQKLHLILYCKVVENCFVMQHGCRQQHMSPATAPNDSLLEKEKKTATGTRVGESNFSDQENTRSIVPWYTKYMYIWNVTG